MNINCDQMSKHNRLGDYHFTVFRSKNGTYLHSVADVAPTSHASFGIKLQEVEHSTIYKVDKGVYPHETLQDVPFS